VWLKSEETYFYPVQVTDYTVVHNHIAVNPLTVLEMYVDHYSLMFG